MRRFRGVECSLLIKCTCCQCEFEYEISEDEIEEILQDEGIRHQDEMRDTFD